MSEKKWCESIEELANLLPIEHLAKLIEINKSRICVFNIGTASIDELSQEFEVVMNGTSIQITVNDSV